MTDLEIWIEKKQKEVAAYEFHYNPSVVSYLIIHHSFTSDRKEVDWNAIRKYHIEVNGWNDIGYHFGIELVGDDYQIMKGRALDVRGAHCKDGGFNRTSIGICIVGNWDVEKPPERQWLFALMFVKRLNEYLATKGMNIKNENVLGHREAQAIAGLTPEQRKSCPGKLFDMDLFRSGLK